MCFLTSVSNLCPTLCDPMDCSTPGFPVHHQLLELAQTHVHRVSDGLTIQPSHPLLSPSPPAFNLSQNQGLSQWVSSSYQVAKALELRLLHYLIFNLSSWKKKKSKLQLELVWKMHKINRLIWEVHQGIWDTSIFIWIFLYHLRKRSHWLATCSRVFHL